MYNTSFLFITLKKIFENENPNNPDINIEPKIHKKIIHFVSKNFDGHCNGLTRLINFAL